MEPSSNRLAANATLHCLAGCSIGEVLGMVLSTALGWASTPSLVISIALAFVSGYSLTALSLLKRGLGFKSVSSIALASDTVSIAVMEIADNGFILLIPNAIHAGLSTMLFWWSLLTSLVVAFVVAFPINRFLLAKGKGHAAVHVHHHHS